MLSRILVFTPVLCLVLGSPVSLLYADTETKRLIQMGDSFPDTTFNAPRSIEDIEYLGVDATDPLTVGDIKAELVLVELLNIFCMTCQMQAPFLTGYTT
jgi:hypothetical protein